MSAALRAVPTLILRMPGPHGVLERGRRHARRAVQDQGHGHDRRQAREQVEVQAGGRAGHRVRRADRDGEPVDARLLDESRRLAPGPSARPAHGLRPCRPPRRAPPRPRGRRRAPTGSRRPSSRRSAAYSRCAASTIREVTPYCAADATPSTSRPASCRWSRCRPTGTDAASASSWQAASSGPARPSRYRTAFSLTCSRPGEPARSRPATMPSACSSVMTLKQSTAVRPSHRVVDQVARACEGHARSQPRRGQQGAQRLGEQRRRGPPPARRTSPTPAAGVRDELAFPSSEHRLAHQPRVAGAHGFDGQLGDGQVGPVQGGALHRQRDPSRPAPPRRRRRAPAPRRPRPAGRLSMSPWFGTLTWISRARARQDRVDDLRGVLGGAALERERLARLEQLLRPAGTPRRCPG